MIAVSGVVCNTALVMKTTLYTHLFLITYHTETEKTYTGKVFYSENEADAYADQQTREDETIGVCDTYYGYERLAKPSMECSVADHMTFLQFINDICV